MCSCSCGGNRKHDELVPMVGVITDIKQALREAYALKISYSAAKRVE